jgi:hypothetical protein
MGDDPDKSILHAAADSDPAHRLRPGSGAQRPRRLMNNDLPRSELAFAFLDSDEKHLRRRPTSISTRRLILLV